jgi:catechol 2,3-dioxygenase-like lactoylglutathione lyase family enzyme
MMTKTGLLHHVEIYVDDLQATKDFWGWFLARLGYSQYQQWDAGISYKRAETYLVFVQTEERYRTDKYHRCHSGLNHLAFHAESQDMVDAITDELRVRGINILYEDRHPYAAGEDCYAVFFEDPMRMKVELCAY